ncbi:BQ2448_3706 [Microbotryum intermedium]|uniref:Eukaryotic translation initiation factor 3 subunit B n=1 Tax=Microbotryum intermedium TaxID=269621 RepID=A0A238FGD6_9BASI|nr:BQ2448_3706 [Microbotryum intermedium]
MSDHDDIDYSDLEAEFASQYVSPLDSVFILDGAPVVGPDRADKLLSAIVKAAKKEAGITLSKDKIEHPLETDAQSKGFMFITLANPTEALAFQRAMHDFKFDKRHTFKVVPFSQVQKYEQIPEDYAEPPAEEWVPREHFRSWLADPAGRDQLTLYAGDDVQIVWNNRNGNHEPAHQRTKWTDSYTQWSPLGTFFATIHGPGVALWAGQSFDRINRFAHAEVKLIDFSPFERYLVTWSPRPIEPTAPFTEEDQGNQIAVWDIMTGALLRTFPMVNQDGPNAAPEVQKRIVWPMFKWSPDEKYLARVTPGVQISVYEVPSMGLLGKKSLKFDGVADFEWAPLSERERDEVDAEQRGIKLAPEPGAKKGVVPVRENKIAFWTPEVQNQPARVTLMKIPSREPIRSKNLFNVHDCKIHWQSNGEFLCVKVDRHTKTKKTQYCNLELFRLRDKDCPVQVIEIKDAVTAFAWEPNGDRFVLITTNDPNHGQGLPGVLLKTSVSFYGFDQRKGDFLPLRTFDNKQSNSIYWSPKGRHVLLATLGSNSKFDIDFWDLDLDREDKTDEKDIGAAIRLITTVEHYGVTDIEWDPSGRYVATSASTWMSSMEPGYVIWDFKGVELARAKVDKFKQLLWRPRPPTLLSKEDQKRIRKNLRDYSRQFEEQDQLEASNVSSELIALRQRLMEEWNAWRSRAKEIMEAKRKEMGRPKKFALLRVEEANVADEVVEEWVEEVISEKEEVIA